MKKILIFLAVIVSVTFTGLAINKKATSFEEEISVSQSRRTTSVQCSATAKSTGQRCKNWTYNWNGRCHVHQ